MLMPTPRVSIRTEDFDLSIEVAALRAGNLAVGAVCSFVGTVRERLQGRYEESYLGLRPGFLLHVFRRRPETP